MTHSSFRLRRMKDPDEIGPDGTTLKDRMQSLMQKIAKDITEAGSACDVYLKKGFLGKSQWPIPMDSTFLTRNHLSKDSEVKDIRGSPSRLR